jgi:hypothetical protein
MGRPEHPSSEVYHHVPAAPSLLTSAIARDGQMVAARQCTTRALASRRKTKFAKVLPEKGTLFVLSDRCVRLGQ